MMNTDELDFLWSKLPHESNYSRLNDYRYWEYRVAVLIGGKVISANSHAFLSGEKTRSDVVFDDLLVEVKTAKLKTHSHYETKSGTKKVHGFMFSHISGTSRKSKGSDILVLIGICECNTGVHVWICDYKNIERYIRRANSLYISCPSVSKTTTKRAISPVGEDEIVSWIKNWKQKLVE